MENKPEPLQSTAKISLRSRPTIIGILNIISGVVITVPTIFDTIFDIFIEPASDASINYFLKSVLTVAIGIFILFSGIQAIRFRSWKVVLAGSICNLLLALFAFAYLVLSNPLVSFLFGIPSLILTILSKRDFSNKAYALSNWSKSVISGMLYIILGTVFILCIFVCLGLGWFAQEDGAYEVANSLLFEALMLFVLGVFTIITGIFVLRHRAWRLVLVGSGFVFAEIPLVTGVFFIFTRFATGVSADDRAFVLKSLILPICAIPILLGIPAFVLALKSKNEFRKLHN
jgi:hypothetical protein